MKKILILILVIAVSIIGCTNEDEGKQGEFKIKVGLVTPEQDIATQSMRHFETEIERLSDGRVEVELFPGGALGGSADIFNGVQDGSIEMCVNIYPPFAQFTDSFLLYNLPYLFKNREIALEFLDGDIAKEIAVSIEDKGFKQLAVFDGGFRNVSNNTLAVHHPDNLKGLKIRTLNNPVQLDYFKAYGANPTPLPYGDIYVGLQTKTIDGQENSFSNIASMKFNEVQTYITDTQHAFDPVGMFINTEIFNNYPEDIQELIIEAAMSTQAFNRQLAIQLEEEAIDKINATSEITYLTPEERQEFIDQSRETYKNFEDQIGNDLLERALNKITELEGK